MKKMSKIILTIFLMTLFYEMKSEPQINISCRVVLVANSLPRPTPTAKGITFNPNLIFNDYEITKFTQDLSSTVKNMTTKDPVELEKACNALGDSAKDKNLPIGMKLEHHYFNEGYMGSPAKWGAVFCSQHLSNNFYGTLNLYWVFKMSTPQKRRTNSGLIMEWASVKPGEIVECPYHPVSPSTTTKKP